MFQIRWKLYSESEILEILTELFKEKGYDVYNIHKIDRRGERGIDMECTRTAENQKVIIAVKKKPKKSDIGQLQDFIKRPANSKIYVYIEEPTTDFKNAMQEVKNRVSFWDSEILTHEVYCTDSRFYLFLVLENFFLRPIYRIVFSFFKVYFKVEKQDKIDKPLPATPEMLNLLWAAKDRSASLHKSLRTLQLMFESMNLEEISDDAKEKMVTAFLLSINNIKFENLDQLESLFSEFLEKYPTNFEQFCRQTKGRSNWTMWTTCVPTLSPSVIIKHLERTRESSKTWENFANKHKVPEPKPESISELLGDVARILANNVNFFEDTVDDLFSIGLLGKWDDMREEFARKSKERSEELKNALRKELNCSKEKIINALTTNDYENPSFTFEAFIRYRAELRQHLSGNDYAFLQGTYSNIKALLTPSSSSSLNKRKFEETKAAIDEALQLLDKKDLWNNIREL